MVRAIHECISHQWRRRSDWQYTAPPLRVLTSELPDSVRVYVKAEWMNPGGSVKDRAARSIVERAWSQGELKPGGVLLDASSGNTGIAYAMLAAALGFELKLCLPANANPERKRTLIAYGAELILTDPAEGSDGAIVEAQKLSAANPTWFYADQYNNDANWQAHYNTTGPELVSKPRASSRTSSADWERAVRAWGLDVISGNSYQLPTLLRSNPMVPFTD